MNRLGQTVSIRLRCGVIAVAVALLVVVMLHVGPTQAAATPTAGASAATLGGSRILTSVSCTAARTCMAVGTDDASSPTVRSYTLAEAWNGKTWTVLPTADPSSPLGNNLYAVACTGANACMAVGAHQIPHGGVPLAEAWNGKTWSVAATPRPGDDSALSSVSCSSAQACMATGFVIRKNGNNWFSEVWNGKTWTIKTAPTPRRTTFSSVGGVSCRSNSLCVAAGDYELNNTSDGLTLGARWNGASWAIDSTPNPRRGVNGSQLIGVSCGATNVCMAVGAYNRPANDGGVTLAEIWNGKTWAITRSRNRANSAANTLQGVSCRSGSGCVAVGSSVTRASGQGLTLAEMWNGRAWTIKNTPTPSGANQSDLVSVSCGAVNACVAVGNYFTNPHGTELPLAEVWNGQTWKITSPF